MACSIIAVSAGAVMQALNPERNTDRKFLSSYGFLSLEHYTPGIPGHRNAKVVTDPLTKKRYVSVINYFVMKVNQIMSVFIVY